MAVIAAIIGASGTGKTTSMIVGPDGTYNPEDYQGMNPESHLVINLDRKPLPIPSGMWSAEKKNYISTSDIGKIKEVLEWASKQEHIKSISLDTLNLYMTIKEYNDRKKMSFDNWRDISLDIIELNHMCNTVLRDDQVVYIFGHTMMQTMPDGAEKEVFSVIGKKLTKVPPESFYTIVLMSRINYGSGGENKFVFQTKAAASSVKTPIGMFDEFEMPNSLKLVDDHIRKYYNI